MAYNYRDAVKADIEDALRDYDLTKYEDRDEAEQFLYDALWLDDSVTGNASGSYTFSTYQAEENLCHNWDEVVRCAYEFGDEPIIEDGYKHGAEYWDVSIRCYYLGQCLKDVLDDIEDEVWSND